MAILKKTWIICIIIFIVAILVRIPFLFQNGLSLDNEYWVNWAQIIQRDGLTQVYDYEGNLKVNYPPLYLYWLQVTVILHEDITGKEVITQDLTYNILTRLPAIIFDAITGIFLFLFLKRNFGRKKALLVGLGYTFLPGIIYDSAVWGQVDSIHTFFMILTLGLLWKKKFALAWVFYAVSLTMKFQGIMVLIPIIIYTYMYDGGIKGLIKNMFYALIVGLTISLPFIVTGKTFKLIMVYLGYAGGGYLAANQLNFWWPIHILWFDNVKNFVSDSMIRIYLIPFKIIGFAMFALSSIIAYKLIKIDRKNIFIASAFCIITFVMFNVGMHDRYLYPFFAVFCMFMLGESKKYLYFFIFFSVSYFYNLVFTLKFFVPDQLFSVWITIPVAILNVIMYFMLLKFLRDEIISRNTNLQREGEHS